MLLESRVSVEEAHAELVDNGVPASIAAGMLEQAVEQRVGAWRSGSSQLLLAGAALLSLGVGVTLWTYASAEPGGGYALMTTVLASGASALVAGALMRLWAPAGRTERDLDVVRSLGTKS